DRTEFVADIIAVPHCEVLPEQLIGLEPGVPPASQFARRLAEAGCRVVVPLLVNRQRGEFDWGARSAPNITNREMLYRSAFELGRGLAAYEVQTLQSFADYLRATTGPTTKLGIIGWGEGGLLALYTGALDTRFDCVAVSGYFGSRQSIWHEPIDRNVCGLLREFGDAEIASMVAPRKLIVEAAGGPQEQFTGAGGGAPAALTSPPLSEVHAELARAQSFVGPLGADIGPSLVISGDNGQGSYGNAATLRALLQQLGTGAANLLEAAAAPQRLGNSVSTAHLQRERMRQLDRHSQQLLHTSPRVRREYFAKLDTSSAETFAASVKQYREQFYDEVIGRYEYPLTAPSPRSRVFQETDNWIAYEVVLDVFDSIYAYGILLVPKDIQRGERRPVVVCQHGLEGRPQDTIGEQGSQHYAGFAGALADRGFITFAPQNLYIGHDRFRTLQRKSYPLGKTLFSIIVPQHQQIVNWLKTLPMVDEQRIAFYGLSYGGKTAMRVPPVVTDYCLSICSADFNDWVDKNASTTNPRSYVWTGEYEIFEFDLGSRFNYAEMAALIAPRPFMVERGHFDGVADDWTVAWEFAKVRELYAAQLKLSPSVCQIEWFVGPHQIHGVGTYEFLHQHLQWPKRDTRR
ncbi:MAG: hypothetical protein KDB23_27590, partial [Planctomycetales bacterium]|nr:hypothetical protein [Planctomycetales bacterium]